MNMLHVPAQKEARRRHVRRSGKAPLRASPHTEAADWRCMGAKLSLATARPTGVTDSLSEVLFISKIPHLATLLRLYQAIRPSALILRYYLLVLGSLHKSFRESPRPHACCERYPTLRAAIA